MSQTRTVKKKEYYPTPTGAKYHKSPAKVKGIMGPVGSGKSVCCVMDLLQKAQQQRPQADGVRRSRWLITRPTYKQLVSTTIKTFQDWVPSQMCKLNMSHSPIDGVLNLDLPDGTKVEATFWFMALDGPDCISDLKSLEITGAWINEARYVREDVMTTLIERAGRYPSVDDGGCVWSGIIMDTNPPDNSHWYYKKAEIIKPPSWEFFRQPPAVLMDEFGRYYENLHGDPKRGIPPAENITRLEKGYYQKQIESKKPMFIKVELEGQYGFLMDGKPVWPMYRDNFHLSEKPLEIYRGLPIIMGTDNGRTPATIIGQITHYGQLRILREFIGVDIGANRFVETKVKPILDRDFPSIPRTNYCDPACNQKSQTDEFTVLDVWNKHGIKSVVAPCSNKIQPRLDAVENRLMRLVDSGTGECEPAIVIDPSCETLRRGLLGGYHFKVVKEAGVNDRFKEEPAKNEFSHVCDALQYMCIAYDDDYSKVSEEYIDAPDLNTVVNTNVVW